MHKVTLSLITASLLIVVAGTPIHDKMDTRLKGKSFGGTSDDNVAAEDGLGVLPLQHHTGTTDMNNELLVQKVFNRVLKSESDKTKTVDIRSSFNAGTVGNADDAAILSNVGVQLTPPTLYTFSTHTFTNCGKTGRYGPSLAQCTAAYSTDWDNDTANFNMTMTGYQIWTVPEDGTYRIETKGANGGYGASSTSYRGGGSWTGYGAIIRGDFSLTKGQKIGIVIGQAGTDGIGNCNCSGGAGGGTFIWDDSTKAPLIIAGGGTGGNGSCHSKSSYSDGTLTTMSGNSTLLSGNNSGNGGASQGTGNGYNGGGGGGWFSNGSAGGLYGDNYGRSFTNGLIGGYANNNGTNGGFGGGAATGDDGRNNYSHGVAGAGGYSGGAGAYYPGSGGGGSSYNTGSNTYTSVGNNSNKNGYAIITKL